MGFNAHWNSAALAHVPEKWAPVFRPGHAPTLAPRRYPLANGEKLRPRICFENIEPLAQIVDLEVIRANTFGELAPGERRRDRCERQRSGRVWRDRGGAAAVPEIVDEDAPAPRGLGHLGEVTLRIGLGHRFSDRLGKFFGLLPVGAGLDRKHDMKPLAARGLHEARQAELV